MSWLLFYPLGIKIFKEFHNQSQYMVQCISDYLDITKAVLYQWKHLRKLKGISQTNDMI